MLEPPVIWAAPGEVSYHGILLQAGLGPLSFSLFTGQASEEHFTEGINTQRSSTNGPGLPARHLGRASTQAGLAGAPED